ncbi:MAG TPA: hypothetical protein VFO42_03510 [Sphingomicrobium sp.]|nr:hypothetical protein [Sphingomicrobium sp.]
MVAGGIARLDRRHRKQQRCDHSQEGGAGDGRQPALAADLVALDQLVEPDPEHPGDDFEEAEPAAVADVAKVGGKRLGAFGGRPPAAVVFAAKRRRQALFGLLPLDLAREGLAGNDCGDDASVRMEPSEQLDLGIGPFRRGRGRRAQDDQAVRGLQRLADLGAQVLRGGKLVPVAEDRRQPARHHTGGGQPPGQAGGHPEALELAVQPVSDDRIVVAVA